MNKEILRLAIPNVLSNISVPLLSSIDTALMGQLSGGHIAAVGLGGMAFNLIYWNFGFLRMGSTGLTAQAYGREAKSESANILGRAMIIATLLAIMILLLQYPLRLGSEWLLNVQSEQVALVDSYFNIRIYAAPATLALMAIFGWFFGMQNAWFPLILTILINALNMGVSYLLVVEYDYGIAGAAWGTVAAQYFGLILALALLLYRYGWVRELINRKALLLREELMPFLRVSSDIFLRTLCLTLSFTFFYNRANAMPGEFVVAANVVLLQLVNWLSYGVDGFAYAAESLVGKYYGRGEPQQLSRAVKLSFIWGIGLGFVYLVAYALLGSPILSLFIDAEAAAGVLETSLYYLPVVLAFCVLATPCYIFDGIYIGLTASRAMRETMLLAFAGYLLTYYLIGRHYENWGLWGSLIAFMVLRAMLQWLWWPKIIAARSSDNARHRNSN
ncbi:MATE family efflux transporter [Lewinellaceae bacterium SD302]|nr:MATE family efflux transporter [Lewinellaceae bacterium SD302]